MKKKEEEVVVVVEEEEVILNKNEDLIGKNTSIVNFR